MPNSLALVRRVRDGRDIPSGTKTERRFLDFVVDGISLFDEFRRRGHEFVSCMCDSLGLEQESRRRLLLQLPGDLPSGRVSLYVCPECGDSGCGTISVLISRTKSCFVWSNFGYENNYDDGFTSEANIGPFEFDAEMYSGTLAP